VEWVNYSFVFYGIVFESKKICLRNFGIGKKRISNFATILKVIRNEENDLSAWYHAPYGGRGQGTRQQG
jgi:hypothetical protein